MQDINILFISQYIGTIWLIKTTFDTYQSTLSFKSQLSLSAVRCDYFLIADT